MNWKLKAALQQAVSLLPSSASFELYYRMQRACGTLRQVNPIEGFENGVRLLAAAEAVGGCVRGKTVLEAGTGAALPAAKQDLNRVRQGETSKEQTPCGGSCVGGRG